MNCHLCHGTSILYLTDKDKRYYRCQNCELIFLEKSFHLSPESELAHYQLHQNNPDDLHYRSFLSPAFQAVKDNLKAGARGLDFGCGPGPTLSVMLDEVGFEMEKYDLYFFNKKDLLKKEYDFITCTEVVEHIANLADFISHLVSLIKTNGYLILMTNLVHERIEFATWYYRQDPTHVSFLNNKTAEYVAKEYKLTLLQVDRNLLVFKKS